MKLEDGKWDWSIGFQGGGINSCLYSMWDYYKQEMCKGLVNSPTDRYLTFLIPYAEVLRLHTHG